MTLPLRPAKPQYIPTKATGSVLRPMWNGVHEREPASPAFTGKPVHGGEKSPDRVLRGRLVQDGERTFHAYSADELIEIDSLAHHGRPGMPY